MGVGGHQLHPGQASGDQPAEKAQPAGAVLGRGDIDTQDLPVAVVVDADRDEGVHVDHPPVFADFEHQGVGGDERVGTGVQGPVAEGLDLLVQLFRHDADLRFRQRRDPEGVDEFFHPSGRDAEQVAGGHHRGQGSFGAFAPLQQPIREVRAGPQLGNGHVEGADAGIEVAVPVAVANVDPFVGALAVVGAAQGIGLGAHQGMYEHRQQLAQQVGAGAGESVFDKPAEVDIVGIGHRVLFRRVELVALSKNHAMTVFRPVTTRRSVRLVPARTPS